MAGSYLHAVNGEGQLSNSDHMLDTMDTLGDAYETIRQMYAMIWLLAQGNPALVEDARQRWRQGIALSPGEEDE